jgi:hypothetical protein
MNTILVCPICDYHSNANVNYCSKCGFSFIEEHALEDTITDENNSYSTYKKLSFISVLAGAMGLVAFSQGDACGDALTGCSDACGDAMSCTDECSC